MATSSTRQGTAFLRQRKTAVIPEAKSDPQGSAIGTFAREVRQAPESAAGHAGDSGGADETVLETRLPGATAAADGRTGRQIGENAGPRGVSPTRGAAGGSPTVRGDDRR